MCNTLYIKFLGAIGTVTGSCTALKFSNEKETRYYLVDIGEYQGESKNDIARDGRKWLAQYAKQIEGIFITHAHYDHVGYLPELVMEHGFSGKIFCNTPTKELMEAILEDSLVIKGIRTYSVKEVFSNIEFIPMDYVEKGKYYSLSNDFRVTTLNSAHVLGSCTFLFHWKKTKDEDWESLYFSGDIGSNDERWHSSILLKEFQLPFYSNVQNINIIMESTYGYKVKDKEDLYERKLEKLTEIIKDAVNNDRQVIFPAFALNRSQEILLDLFYLRDIKKAGYKEYVPKFKKKMYDRIANKTLERCLRKEINGETNEDMRRDVTVLWGRYFSDPVDWDVSISDIQEEMIDEILELRLKYSHAKQYYIAMDSYLMRKICKVYNKYLLNTFEKKDGTLGYKYLSKEFIEKFCASSFDNAQKILKAKEILYEIFIETPETEELQKTSQKSKKKNVDMERYRNAHITVSSSGMCDEGSVIKLLEKYLPDENAVVVLSGYQATNTNGYHLKNMHEYSENKKVCTELHNIDLRLSDVKCKIIDLSEFYSGHADQDMLFEFVAGNDQFQNKSPTRVFLNHGQDESRTALKERLESLENVKVEIPDDLSWYDLNIGERIIEDSSNVSENNIRPIKIYQDECIQKGGMDVRENDIKRFDVGDITVLIPDYYGEDVFRMVKTFLAGIGASR